MSAEEKIDIDLFKVVFRAMAQSDNLEIMANHLTQLLVAALEIKGCTIFALNPESNELEDLASFGLSMSYLEKGPVLSDKSITDTSKGQAHRHLGCQSYRPPSVSARCQGGRNRGHRFGANQLLWPGDWRLKTLPPRRVGYLRPRCRLTAGARGEHRPGHDIHPGP